MKLNYLVKAVLLMLAAVICFGIYLWQVKGVRYYSVQSDSMKPTLMVGDLVIAKKTTPNYINSGDIVSFVSSANSNIVVTHRVVSADHVNRLITTRGDNIVSPDTPIDYPSVVGKEVVSIPYLGYVLDALRRPIGLILMVYIPMILLAIAEIRILISKLNRSYKHANLS